MSQFIKSTISPPSTDERAWVEVLCAMETTELSQALEQKLKEPEQETYPNIAALALSLNSPRAYELFWRLHTGTEAYEIKPEALKKLNSPKEGEGFYMGSFSGPLGYTGLLATVFKKIKTASSSTEFIEALKKMEKFILTGLQQNIFNKEEQDSLTSVEKLKPFTNHLQFYIYCLKNTDMFTHFGFQRTKETLKILSPLKSQISPGLTTRQNFDYDGLLQQFIEALPVKVERQRLSTQITVSENNCLCGEKEQKNKI